MRLDKLIEHHLQISRKKTKRLFLQRKVLVNQVIEMNPARNVDSQLHKILVDGRELLTDESYYLLNKPAGIVTANVDKKHRTVIDLLAEKDRHPELSAVGRLDRDTEGLVLLTTNGQLSYRLAQAKGEVIKNYEVRVKGLVTMEDVQAFKEGITFHGGILCRPAELSIIKSSREESHAILAISEGKFHQVKKMFLARGKKVIYLKRISIGPLILPKDLAVGGYRPITQGELQRLEAYFQ